MAVWNVCVPVIAVLTGDTGADAEGRLRAALDAAGFQVYEPLDPSALETRPIEAEADTEPYDNDPPFRKETP